MSFWIMHNACTRARLLLCLFVLSLRSFPHNHLVFLHCFADEGERLALLMAQVELQEDGVLTEFGVCLILFLR